jgi:hypothetical protein
MHSAKYWYGRAVEENPDVRLAAAEAYERLAEFGIEHLVQLYSRPTPSWPQPQREMISAEMVRHQGRELGLEGTEACKFRLLVTNDAEIISALPVVVKLLFAIPA